MQFVVHAAKFEEHEENMVCMEQLQTMAHQCGEDPDHYTKQEFLKMELYLLKFFDWSVSYPTAVHFAEYFLSTEDTEMTEEETCNPVISGSPLSQLERGEIRTQMDRLTSCFLEASLRGKCPLMGTYIDKQHGHVADWHTVNKHVGYMCSCL